MQILVLVLAAALAQPAPPTETNAARTWEAFRAIGQGDEAALTRTLTEGVDASLIGRDGTLLCAAVRSKNLRMATALIGYGLQPSHPSKPTSEWKPLEIAARQQDLAMCELLLQHGADPSESTATTSIASIPLVSSPFDDAFAEAWFKALKARSCEKTSIAGRGLRVIDDMLYQACRHGRVNWVSRLLDEGADMNALNKPFGTPLTGAVRFGHTEIARLLLSKGARLDSESLLGSPLYAAVQRGDLELVRLIGDAIKAAASAKPDAAKPDPLILSAALSRYSGPESADIIRFLIKDLGIRPESLSSKEDPLQTAIGASNPDAVEVLLEVGVQPGTLRNTKLTHLDSAKQSLGREPQSAALHRIVYLLSIAKQHPAVPGK